MVFDALRFTQLTQFHNEEKSWLQRGAAEKFTRGMSHSSLSSGAPTSRRDIKDERLEEHDSVNVWAANSTNRYFLPGLSPEKPFVLIFRTLSLSLVLTPPVWKFTNSSEVSSEDEKQRRKQRCNSSLRELFWRERGVGKQSRGGKDLSKAVKMVFNANF